MVAPVLNLDPTILTEGSAKLRFYLFLGSSEAAMGGGGAQRPVGRGNESKKTGARSARGRSARGRSARGRSARGRSARGRSARARTRGQNPLVYIYITE